MKKYRKNYTIGWTEECEAESFEEAEEIMDEEAEKNPDQEVDMSAEVEEVED